MNPDRTEKDTTPIVDDSLQKQLEVQNAQLQQELTRRKRAEEALQRANEKLEQRVAERTAELAKANASLKADIVGRKQVEETLRESEQKYRSLVENSPAGIVILNDAYEFVYMNNELSRIAGYPREEIMGQDFREFLDDESKQLIAERYASRQRGEEVPAQYESNIIRKDGQKRRVEISASVITDPAGNAWTMGQLLDITERKRLAMQLAAIYQLGQELTLLHDEATIVQRALDTASSAFHFEVITCGLVDEAAGELVFGYHLTGSTLKPLNVRLPLTGREAKGISVAVVRSGQAINVPDTTQDPRYVQGGDLPGRSELCVPLKVDERVIGVLDVESIEPDHFTAADQQLLQTLADQTAVALENARLYMETQRQTRELAALNKAGRAMTSSLDLEIVLDQVMSEVKTLLGTEGASVLLYDPASEKLVFVAAAGPGFEAMIGMRMPITAGIAGWVMRERQPILVDDVRQDSRFYGRIDIATGLTTRSLLAVPLTFKEKSIGVVEAINKARGNFNRRDLELLEALTSSAAIAIENARLHTETEQRAQQLAVLHELDQTITASLYIDDVYYAYAQHVARLIPYDRMSIALREGEVIRVAYVQGRDKSSPPPGATLPLKTSATGWVVMHNQPLLRHDITSVTQFSEDEQLAASGIRSAMIIPLCIRGQVIGAWNMGSRQVGRYNPDNLEMAQAMADQLSIAIENARLFEQAQQEVAERKRAEDEIRRLNEELEQRVADRTRELSALYEVTTVASESLDLQTTLERSLERVLVAMGSSTGAIHLLDETGKRLHLAVQQGLPPDPVVQIDSMPVDSGLTGWVINYDKPLIVPDTAADPRAIVQLPHIGPKIYGGVPMRASGRVVGVLSLFREKTQSGFNAEEVALLTSIADQVGVVVESARLRQRAEQAAIIEERARLARELHDSVTQTLYSLTLFAEWGRRLFEAGELESARQRLVEIGETAQQALKEMRLLVYELRPAVLEQDGLVGALQRRLEAVEKRATVEVSLLAEPPGELPAWVEEGLYRIAQEALNNALKHAAANLVTVRVQTDGRQVTLEVEDNGSGFVPETVSNKGGLGLLSMQERAEQLGGVLGVVSAPGEGTKVRVTVEVS